MYSIAFTPSIHTLGGQHEFEQLESQQLKS